MAEPFHTMLVDHPDFVHEIGMITVEQCNIEYQLADLMGAILRVHNDVAHAIYFTPRAGIARVEVMLNLNNALHPDPEIDAAKIKDIRKRIRAACERARTLIGRRNELIHAVWGTDPEGKEVHYAALPIKQGAVKRANIVELRDMVDRMRKLISQIRQLEDDVVTAQEEALRESET